MAKAKTVRCRCQTCGAGFQAATDKAKNCPAHRQQTPDMSAAPAGSSATSWVPHAKLKLADRVEQWLYAHSADNECEHGALPHDRKLPGGCECWGKRYPFEEQELIKAPTKKRAKNAKAA